MAEWVDVIAESALAIGENIVVDVEGVDVAKFRFFTTDVDFLQPYSFWRIHHLSFFDRAGVAVFRQSAKKNKNGCLWEPIRCSRLRFILTIAGGLG